MSSGTTSSGDRWKERVELSLDGRQIFFLFFGSAVLACLLFVAGVLVGRRIEHRAAVPLAGDDPLAALDQLDSTEPDDGLTFHESLLHADKRATAARPGSRAARPDAAARKPDPGAARKPEVPAAASAAAAPRKPESAAPHPPSGHFTLQLSSFADRADADRFAARIKDAGLEAQVVESEVPGKGTYFRVRTGDYKSRQAAAEAKSEYEKSHGGIAMVVGL